MIPKNNINLDNLAPIVLFTYNHLWHTQQTIEASTRVLQLQLSNSYGYGSKPDINEISVEQVLEVVKSGIYADE